MISDFSFGSTSLVMKFCCGARNSATQTHNAPATNSETCDFVGICDGCVSRKGAGQVSSLVNERSIHSQLLIPPLIRKWSLLFSTDLVKTTNF